MMFKDLGFNHTFINKQKMKTSVMFIGLAVICIGMSFIMLGVNQGGGELSSNSELNFNLTIGSTGLAAILIGAYLVFSGGTTNNEYRPGGIPGFLYSSETGASIGSQFSEAEHKMAGCLKLATSTINEFSKQTNKTPIKNDFIQAAIDCTTDNIIEYYSGIHDENKK
jgi:hypothetical protein